MKPKTANLIELNIAVLLWGGTAMFAKGIDLPSEHITGIRSLIAAAALLAFIRVTRSPMRIKRPGHWGIMAVLGLLLCMHWVTFFWALQISTAAVAILSLHTYPVLTALIEPLVFREKLHKIDIAIAAIVFAGVLIMTPELSLSNKTTQGILLGVLSGLFFMARNLMTRKYVQQYTSSSLMFYQTLVTGLVLLPVIFLSEAKDYGGKTVGLLVLLGVAFTALPQTLFSASFKHLSAKTVGILATLLPFYAAFWGYMIHEEEVTSRIAIGGILILACVIFETMRNVKAK